VDTRTLHLLQQTAAYFSAQRHRAYLVGGSVRNLLLGELCLDWDIVTDGSAPALARRLADTLEGYYAYMHEKASRVVVKNGHEISFDIAPLMGHTIEYDLRQRDFTINAIAVPLADAVQQLGAEADDENVVASLVGARGGTGARLATRLRDKLIDPLHGAADIGVRRLRAVSSDVFRHDPLRMLRAVRLRMRYQLTIDNWTQSLMMRDAALLPSVAAERIHDELYAILEPVGATEQLRFLDALGLLTVLIPEFTAARDMPQPSPHYWDVLEHSLETVGTLEQLALLLQGDVEQIRQSEWETSGGDLVEIQTLLHEAEEQGIFQLALLAAPRMKLAALLHDIGKPATYTTDDEGFVHFYGHPQIGVPLAQQIMKRLSVSKHDSHLVQQVTAHHMRPGQLGHASPVTPRAIRRYFVDLGHTGIYVALFSLADHLATQGPQPLTASWERHVSVVRLLLTSYIRERESILPPQLISAEELMRRLKLEPGPIVGQLLEQLAEAQADGLIHSKEEAFWLAEEYLPKK
jgi:poly(A) polymerase